MFRMFFLFSNVRISYIGPSTLFKIFEIVKFRFSGKIVTYQLIVNGLIRSINYRWMWPSLDFLFKSISPELYFAMTCYSIGDPRPSLGTASLCSWVCPLQHSHWRLCVFAAPCCGAEAAGQEVESGGAAAHADPLLRGESVARDGPGWQGAARDPPLPVAAGAHLEPPLPVVPPGPAPLASPTPRPPFVSDTCKTPQPPEGAMHNSGNVATCVFFPLLFSCTSHSARCSVFVHRHCVESAQEEPTHPIAPLAWMRRKRMCFVREFPWLLGGWCHRRPRLTSAAVFPQAGGANVFAHDKSQKRQHISGSHSGVQPRPNRYSSLVFHCRSIAHNLSTFKQYVIAY